MRALLVAWAGIATVVGALLWQAATDPDVQLARARDVVLDAGSRALVDLNTIAPGDAEAALARWERVATGALLEDLQHKREQNLAAVRGAATSTSARLLRAAVTEVDVDRARMIAALEVTENKDLQVTRKHSRLDAELARTPEGWKLASVEVVAISAGEQR